MESFVDKLNSIINEGKGKVFVKAVFLLGSPSRLFLSRFRMNQESEEFRATKILCSILPLFSFFFFFNFILPFSMAVEVGRGLSLWRVSNFLDDSKELLFWTGRLYLGESVVQEETKL